MEILASTSGKPGRSRRILTRTLDVLGLKKPAKSAAKLIQDTWQVAKGLVVYKRVRETPWPSQQSAINLFCATEGLSHDLLSWAVSKYRPPIALPHTRGLLGDLTPDDLERIIRVLDERGYYVFEKPLSEEVCDRLMKFSLSTKAVARVMDSEDPAKHREKAVYFDRSNPAAVRYDYRVEDMVMDPTIQAFLGDLSIIGVAQAYLRTSPVNDIIGMWWHTSFSKSPDSHAAQMFHFDLDRLRWLKFFSISLTLSLKAVLTCS